MLRSLGVFCILLGSGTAYADDLTIPVPWSISVIDRPLTMPAGNFAVYGDLDVFKLDSGGLTATSEVLHGGVGYAVADQVTLGVDYAFNLHSSSSFDIAGMTQSSDDSLPGNGRGPLIPYGTFRLAHGPVSSAVSVGLVANLAGEESIDSTNGTTFSTTYDIIAGIVIKYNVAPTVALYTGAPVGGAGIGFAGSPFGPGPLGNQLDVPLSKNGSGDSAPATFALPIGAGFQITPQFFGYVQTTFVRTYLSNKPVDADSTSVIGSDAEKGGVGIPLTVGAFFSPTQEVELGATVAFPDLQHAGDLYLFGLAARFYSGK